MMTNCTNRYYLKKARVHDRESPSTFFTLNDCLARMNEHDLEIKRLKLEIEKFRKMLNANYKANIQLEELCKQLETEKESWKQLACSSQNENNILNHELGIVIEQGYKVSDAFKEYRENTRQRLKEAGRIG